MLSKIQNIVQEIARNLKPKLRRKVSLATGVVLFFTSASALYEDFNNKAMAMWLATVVAIFLFWIWAVLIHDEKIYREDIGLDAKEKK